MVKIQTQMVGNAESESFTNSRYSNCYRNMNIQITAINWPNTMIHIFRTPLCLRKWVIQEIRT